MSAMLINAQKASENSVRLYVGNALSSVATRVLQLTVLVWVNQYLLRRIEPAEYSLFPVVMSVVLFADVFKNIFTGGLGRYIVEADSRGDQLMVTRIVSSMLPFLVAAALLIAAAGSVAAWKLETLLNIDPAYLPDARLMLVLLVCMICLHVIASPFAVGLYVRQRFVAQNVIDLSCEVIRIGILFVLLFGISTKVMWLVVASTCAGFLNILLRVILTRRLLPSIQFKRKLVSADTARRLMSFGAWTSIQGITDLVSSTAPALILNRFATPLDVSAFHLGRLPDIQLRRVAAAASIPAQPTLTSIYAKRGQGALTDLYYRGGRYHLWATLLVVAPLLVFGKEMVNLYVGSAYAATAGVIFSLLVIYPLVWASAMFYRIAHAIGKVRAYYFCDIVVQVVTLGALFYAVSVRGLGASGAALAVALSSGTLHLILIWPMGLRLINGHWGDFVRQTLFPGILPFAMAFGVCYAIGTFIEMNSWLSIAGATVIAVAVYTSGLLAFCLDPVDRRLLAKVTAKIGGTFD